MIKLACMAFSCAWFILAAYSLDDLHKRQYDAHHRGFKALPSPEAIAIRELFIDPYNEK